MPSQQQLANLRAVVPAAQQTAAAYGVPASVTLAQWIVESGWGMTGLAERANNCFGIKVSHLAAPDTYVEFPTHEYLRGKYVLVEADFAKYSSVAESFAAHARLLALAPRYKPAMAVCHNPASFAAELQKCGYSDNPNYATELMEYVRLYNLTQYDAPPPAAEMKAA